MSGLDPIATARLVLRPMRLDDAAALHGIYGDPAAMHWWSHPPHDTLEQTRAKVARNLAAEGWTAFVIVESGADQAIGTLAAHEERQGEVFEIGYALARSAWGRGLASEAVSAWIDRLIDLGARRIAADTDPDNTASNRLLERLGFTCEGRLRETWRTHIGVRDSFIWGLLAAEWRAGRRRG